MSGRFSRPVFPGDSLVMSIWLEGGEALFQTATEAGAVVIDRGRMRYAPQAASATPPAEVQAA